MRKQKTTGSILSFFFCSYECSPLSPDVLFEKDEHVMPLMSAATVWSSLENVVEDEGLFKEITILLFVQVLSLSFQGLLPIKLIIFEHNN